MKKTSQTARVSAPGAQQALWAQREAFRRFLAKELKDGAAAEDILQVSLVKALEKADNVREPGALIGWFYEVLRRAVIDHYRAESSRRKREHGFSELLKIDGDRPGKNAIRTSRAVCACLGGVIAGLSQADRELLNRVDLEGGTIGDAAKFLGIAPNAASVRLHRARERLRRKLVDFCGACAEGACLDCGCDTTG
jgi:RNA polymerase sigma factor (sigma-70 family)